MFPIHIANSSEHVACYKESSRQEHLPVIVDFGAIQSPAERQENDVPVPHQHNAPSIEDVKAVEAQLQIRFEAILAHAHADSEATEYYLLLLLSLLPLLTNYPIN